MITTLQQKLKESGYIGKLDLYSLIEACGNRFAELSKGQTPIDYKWTAQGYPIQTMFSHGDSPEEAVANLYLELNKK